MRFCYLARGETMSSDSNRRSVTNVETPGNQVTRVSNGFPYFMKPVETHIMGCHGFPWVYFSRHNVW